MSETKPLSIALAAEESAGVQVLQRLLKGGAEIALVLASAKRSGSMGGSVWDAADQAGLPLMRPRAVKRAGFADELRERRVDLLLTVRCPYIVAPEVLEAPAIGAYNLHTGPLPEAAGRNVVSWSIFEGAREHGVTVHRTVPDVDAGPIAYEKRFPIGADDTAVDVLRRSIREGVKLVLELVRQAAEDPASVPAAAQDSAQRRVFGREAPSALGQPLALDQRALRDLVRACRFFPFPSPWGTPQVHGGGRALGLLGVGPQRDVGGLDGVAPGTLRWEGHRDPDGLLLAATDGWVELTEVEVNGERLGAREALAGVAQVTGSPN